MRPSPSTRKLMNHHRRHMNLLVEQLEPRFALSLLVGDLGAADARGPAAAPPIRLDLVALHELGHSLGLEHDNTSAPSIMDPYYNADYNLNNFLNDPAVARLQEIYANITTSGWNDLADADDGASDSDIDLTYSFMPGGVRMDGGKPVYSTAVPAEWETIIVEQIARWTAASGNKLAFHEVGDGSYPFNAAGATENDPRFGDIRIGAHYFDGPSKVLAHAYYPPPHGATAAGDLHFDNSENWVNGSSSLPRSDSTTSSGATGGTTKAISAKALRGEDLAYLQSDPPGHESLAAPDAAQSAAPTPLASLLVHAADSDQRVCASPSPAALSSSAATDVARSPRFKSVCLNGENNSPLDGHEESTGLVFEQLGTL